MNYRNGQPLMVYGTYVQYVGAHPMRQGFHVVMTVLDGAMHVVETKDISPADGAQTAAKRGVMP